MRDFARRPFFLFKRKKRRSLANFFLLRYVVSLVAVALFTTVAIYWLLYSTQNQAIKLSLDATEDFIMNSVQYQARNYEFQSLSQSLDAFRSTLEFRRIEVIGPYGKPIADSGDVMTGTPPNSIIPILSDTGANYGTIRIWYSKSQHAWENSRQNALYLRAFASIFFFLFVVVGYTFFFWYLIGRHFNKPISELVTHMNTSQDVLRNRNQKTPETSIEKALSVPKNLTSFEETNALAEAYSRLEADWISADLGRLEALNLERNQRLILLEVLQLAKITIAYKNLDGDIELMGCSLPETIGDLLRSSGLEEKNIISQAEEFDLSAQNAVFRQKRSNYSLVVELEDEMSRKFSLHRAIVDARKAIIIREVTQERSLEQAVLRSEKLKAIGTLSSSIAHDFNNVIATMLVNLELIKDYNNNRQKVPLEIFEGIENTASSVTGRIRSIRQLALNNEVNLETVDQYTRLQELKIFIAPTLGTNISLNFVFEDRRPVVCDANEFESCIMNLLVNAKYAMNGKGHITVMVRSVNEVDLGQYPRINREDYVAIDVEDDGVGVPHAIENLIFDPFFSTRKLAQGTGLGLAQVQAFCRRAGGYIYLERNRKIGAKFTILLPTSDRPAQSKYTGKPNLENSPKRATVYILDDNFLLAKTTAKLLERYSIEAFAFSSLREIEALNSKRKLSGILLSDVHMPDCAISDVVEFVEKHSADLTLGFYSGNEESLANIRRLYPNSLTVLKPFKTKILVEMLLALNKRTSSVDKLKNELHFSSQIEEMKKLISR